MVRSEDLDRDVLTPNPEMLATTLGGTASPRGRRTKLGQELRKRRDAVLGGHRVRVSDGVDRHGCWRYWLEAVHALTNVDGNPTTRPAEG